MLTGDSRHRLGADEIAGLVPHAGAMCLLDGVLDWDATRLRAVTARHRSRANPLRRDGMLPAACGLEFAFQAMALHGALGRGSGRAVGFLSSLRDVSLTAERLDDVEGELLIEVEALIAEPVGSVYRFAISEAGRALLAGQQDVILK